jgi:signal transduction histidine kinase
MIELTRVNIDSYSQVIETRNKVFCLMRDLDINQNAATRLTSRISETIRLVLLREKLVTVILGFTKSEGHYYMHVYISYSDNVSKAYEQNEIFMTGEKSMLEDKINYLDFSCKVKDSSFIPNADFLEDERQRLIKESSGEMLREIKQKNMELTKAIEDLKNSGRMIQTEKMRALGSMTAGVAHELNNPMMGILNFIQYCIKHTEEDDRRYQVLMDSEREVVRCQEIITNLLTFSRMKEEGDEGSSSIKPSELFERVIQLVQYKTRETNVKIETDFPAEEMEIFIKINNMQQVLLNLVTNAIDAMKELEERHLKLSIRFEEEKVRMLVKDSGTGMDEETIDKIFEPFFTTKKTGEGTGLGLAVSQSIIEQHKGSLMCESRLGEGTTFIISLPINKQKNSNQEE